LIERGGVYYEIFEREDKHTNLIVLFFEDSLIDVTAEVMNLKANLMDFDCLLNFKAYARDHFKSFNARQMYSITQKLLHEEVDLDTLTQTGVISDYLNLHERDK